MSCVAAPYRELVDVWNHPALDVERRDGGMQTATVTNPGSVACRVRLGRPDVIQRSYVQRFGVRGWQPGEGLFIAAERWP